ncbi:hypothetical protein FC54_GL000777 [Ligilactobacillus saerimneri DSM 16049]|nr:hypothetical protein FC54_GL000777 [Ligilactobacillus saerimneri DSM 16049]
MQERNITTLYHFTYSANLPYILDYNEEYNGIQSINKLKEMKTVDANITDSNRYDGHRDYICCSLSRPNKYYFKVAKKRNSKKVFTDWVVMSIEADIINETTKYCPTNAATGGGKYIGSGFEAFEEMFKDKIEIPNKPTVYRSKNEKPKNTTDYQAEILIKDKIPIDKIKGIYFDARSVEMEYYRLQLWVNENLMKRLKFGKYSIDNETYDLKFDVL